MGKALCSYLYKLSPLFLKTNPYVDIILIFADEEVEAPRGEINMRCRKDLSPRTPLAHLTPELYCFSDVALSLSVLSSPDHLEQE